MGEGLAADDIHILKPVDTGLKTMSQIECLFAELNRQAVAKV